MPKLSELYDPQCGELARYFLGDKASDRIVKLLACEIQGAVEDCMISLAIQIKADLESISEAR